MSEAASRVATFSRLDVEHVVPNALSGLTP